VLFLNSLMKKAKKHAKKFNQQNSKNEIRLIENPISSGDE